MRITFQFANNKMKYPEKTNWIRRPEVGMSAKSMSKQMLKQMLADSLSGMRTRRIIRCRAG
ncbi:hypothetical protein I380019A4_14590 [Sutterella wadsworthensis]|jgi:hypothetical protein